MAAEGGAGRSATPAVPAAAEAAADEVVRRVRPTEASERRRAEVVNYARRLVGASLGCEVFAFGSVPLKTYLPDGDIDLTILGNASHDSTLIKDVKCVLESEEQNSDAEFEVKDSNLINAEVRLIKCTIENIIVDISFNQTGGICALCFLELVDRKVGKNHLFKRSIILIKAWCYYESRLLGAHHGLISTYALEVLILYIFNLFHKNLHGPLEVLYRFLEYFSKFDWDNYCISLNGPVALSSLPNLIVEATATHADDLLFDKEVLKCSVDKASVAQRNSYALYTRFRPKHLNIIDPLKEDNNLGRSVNKASFHRIRTALSYGARKLGHILALPSELVPDGIYGFFRNTLVRNGKGVRPDIGSDDALHPSLGTDNALLEDILSMKISYKKEDENRVHHLLKRLGNNNSHVRTNGPTHYDSCFPGGNNAALSNTYLSTGSSHFVHHAPEQFPLFYQENGNTVGDRCYVDHEIEQVSHCSAKAFHLDTRLSIQSKFYQSNLSHTLNSSAGGNTLEVNNNKRNWSAIHKEKQHFSVLPLSFPDLSGDLDSQFRCLRQVQYHLEYLFDGFLQSIQEAYSNDKVHKESFHIPMLSCLLNSDAALHGLVLPSPTINNERKSSPVSYTPSMEDGSEYPQGEDPWDVACQQTISLPSGTDVPSSGHSPSSYADSEISSVSWCHSLEDIPKKNGTNTYLAKKSYDTCKEGSASSRENGKTLTNRPAKTKSCQASAEGGGSMSYKERVAQASIEGGSFVSDKERVALNSRTKEVIIGQPLKVWDSQHGYIRSDRKVVEKQSCNSGNGYVRYDDEERQIPKYCRDAGSNKNKLQRQCYDTGMQKCQPFDSQNALQDCACASPRNNFSRKQSCNTRKEYQILDWPTKQILITEPLKLQSKRRGWVSSQKNSTEKHSDNPKEHVSSVKGAEHIPCSRAMSTLNGLEMEVYSDKHVGNGGLVLPEVQVSHHGIDSQQMLTVSDISQPSFSVVNGLSVENIEFGSLGPFALTFFSSKSNGVTNTNTTSKAFTDASAVVLERSRAVATESRSPAFCKMGDEDEFPRLNARI